MRSCGGEFLPDEGLPTVSGLPGTSLPVPTNQYLQTSTYLPTSAWPNVAANAGERRTVIIVIPHLVSATAGTHAEATMVTHVGPVYFDQITQASSIWQADPVAVKRGACVNAGEGSVDTITVSAFTNPSSTRDTQAWGGGGQQPTNTQ